MRFKFHLQSYYIDNILKVKAQLATTNTFVFMPIWNYVRYVTHLGHIHFKAFSVLHIGY